MSNTVETVTQLAVPVAEELGYELVDVEYTKEGKTWFLRLYIDKPEGIDLDDCAFFSEKMSETLDAQDPDPIPHAYYLEVSSPGAERPLKNEKDFQRAVGKYIHVTLHQTVEGESIYEGTLDEVTEDSLIMTIRIKTRSKQITLPKEHIAKARLAVQF
ncbi:ribosome maturation factor RimP [Atopococcus tabaci]|uniref:ribosome maturation factor RimP n=1 Tax=Atopococcus tabaci TaxID=269774 RepID=UPI000404BFB9|nr:ribosome maturation factor RimP [Atopococcus tabaci]